MKTRRTAWIATTALATLTVGCSQPPAAPAPVVEEKTYGVKPASVMVNAGIITGNVTDIRITERVESGSGKIVSPARMTGKLTLKNTSADQTFRLIGGTVRYIDAQGRQIKVGAERVEPTFRFTGVGSSERLDPGQDATQSLDMDFPAEALQAQRLKEIRLDLSYIPSAFKEETLKFGLSVGND